MLTTRVINWADIVFKNSRLKKVISSDLFDMVAHISKSIYPIKLINLTFLLYLH